MGSQAEQTVAIVALGNATLCIVAQPVTDAIRIRVINSLVTEVALQVLKKLILGQLLGFYFVLEL